MPKYVVHDNKVYRKDKTDLFTTYNETEVQQSDSIAPEWHGKKIPMQLWQEILAFMKVSYDKFKSETLIFLYYDETAKQPWSYWVPPQITNGMTVKSDPDHEDFAKQRANYPDTMFGTVHHHCSSSAFQSGTDEADETNREGYHFTVGKLNSSSLVELHLRVTLGGVSVDIDDVTTIISGTTSPFKRNVPMNRDMLNIDYDWRQTQCATLPNVSTYTFDKEMENVEKPVVQSWSSYKKPYKQAYYQPEWAVGSHYSTHVKKTETPANPFDTLDTVVEQISQCYEAEPILTKYITEYDTSNAHQRIDDLLYGRTTDEEYEELLFEILNQEIFTSSSDGKKLLALIKNYIKDTNCTLEHLKEELSDIYEDRGTIQHLDTEAIL